MDLTRTARPNWLIVDWAIALYATYVVLVALVHRSAVPQWPFLLVGHGVLVCLLLFLPRPGAPWERPRREDPRWLAQVRGIGRFLRYTYPALLLTPFFEEVWLTVNAASPDAPYWFERHLYAADKALFGATPAVSLSQAGWPALDELMHALYFSYYPLIIGGIILAWRAGARGGERPAPGFHMAMTCMMLGFFLSYVWYPFLPARGPWESPALMAGLRPFDGWVFTRAIDLIIAGGAVSGGCFPSAHVSGTWALVFGLYPSHRKASLWFALVALGLTLSCVYTRYHHGVDALAGLGVAVVAAMAGRWLTRAPLRIGEPLIAASSWTAS